MKPTNATTYSKVQAAKIARRHPSTIRKWIYSGHLKTLQPSPMQDRRRVVIGALDLYVACTQKAKGFKQPRYPHLFRKREVDKERARTKYARTPEKREYDRRYKAWQRAKAKAAKNAVN